MNNQDKVKLTINIINNDEKNLICNCCSRPILPKDFDEIIDLNYKNAPEFIKIHFKNYWLNGYNNLKKSNLPLNKIPRRLNVLKWDNFLEKSNWVDACNQIIENLITNEELNLTDEHEKRFREELNVLIENNNFYENSHEHSHDHLHDHNHQHLHNNNFEHNI
tara:strand:+ start:1779 stop:2267 length:489 start_codon:yes stop_codon:yes gene_type:complete